MDRMDRTDSNRNLILFVVLSFGILILWAQLNPAPKKVPKPNKSKTSQRSTTSRPSGPAKATSQPSSLAKASSRPTSVAQAASLRGTTRPNKAAASRAVSRAVVKRLPRRFVTFEHPLFSLRISNYGGGVVGFASKQFRDPENKKKRVPLQVISRKLGKAPPFSERFAKPATRKQIAASALSKEGLIIYQDIKVKGEKVLMKARLPILKGGALILTKTMKFRKERYGFDVNYKLENLSSQTVSSDMTLLLRDIVDPEKLKGGGFFGGQAETFEALCLKRKLKAPTRSNLAALKKKPLELKGQIDYIALDRRYFMMAWLAGKNNKVLTRCKLTQKDDKAIMGLLTRKGSRLAPKGAEAWHVEGFLGPKFYQRLTNAGTRLETSVDFGIFAFISKPMLWFMQWIYNLFGRFGNWGVAIILLTVFVKLLLWIPTQRQMESMKKMSKLAPEMKRLKEKYGDDKEALNREMMALYQKEGVNPLGGCLPMLIQMPIWIALYNTLFYAVELYQAPFIPGWIDDLSVRDPIYVLPVVLGISMFFQQRMTPSTGMDDAQARMLKVFMPVFFTAIMLFLPAGLTLYIFVNTLISALHQWLVYNQPDKPSKPKPNFLTKMNDYVEKHQALENQKPKAGRKKR